MRWAGTTSGHRPAALVGDEPGYAFSETLPKPTMDHPDRNRAAALRPEPRGDRFTLAFALLTLPYFLHVAFGHELDLTFSLYLLLVPLLILPGLLLLGILVFSLVLNLFRRRWRRALSVLVAPILAAAPLVLSSHLGLTPEWLRFRLDRARYEREIAQRERQPGTPRLHAFAWGETGGAGVTNLFHTLVYDESDEIGLPPAKRSAGWLERAGGEPRLQGILSEYDRPTVRALGGHFFAVTQAY